MPEIKNTDVSVVIPAYRASHTLPRAIESVAGQTALPREVIVVDDGSDDDTYETALSLKRLLPDTDYLVERQPRLGVGAARNKAVALAHGRFLAFLDADDEWKEDKLERSLEALANKSNRLTAHNYTRVNNGEAVFVDCTRHMNTAHHVLVPLYRRGFIATSTVVVSKELVEKAHGFDTSLPVAQDFDLWLRIAELPDTEICMFDGALTNYYITPASITTKTKMRLICGLKIAISHAPCLGLKKEPIFRNLWFRVLAIHYEALSKERERNRPAGAVGYALLVFPNLVVATLKVFAGSFFDKQES